MCRAFKRKKPQKRRRKAKAKAKVEVEVEVEVEGACKRRYDVMILRLSLSRWPTASDVNWRSAGAIRVRRPANIITRPHLDHTHTQTLASCARSNT